MAGEPLIVCEDLKRRYGDYAALKGVSFSVARGEFAAVMGPSGCGKSTLLACWACSTARAAAATCSTASTRAAGDRS